MNDRFIAFDMLTERMKPDAPSSAPAMIEQLAVEHESHRGGGETRIGIEQGDHRRHVGTADRDDHQHSEGQGDQHDHREDPGLAGMKDQVGGESQGKREEAKVDEVLAPVGDRPLRQDLLKLPRGHQAARERERAEDDLQRQHGHHEPRHLRALEGNIPPCRRA